MQTSRHRRRWTKSTNIQVSSVSVKYGVAGLGDSVVLWVGDPGSGPGNAKLIVFHTRFHSIVFVCIQDALVSFNDANYYYNGNDIY